MSINSRRQLENTLQKLADLEKLYAEAQAEPGENARVKELTLRSYKGSINELKEEIARYRAHATTDRR